MPLWIAWSIALLFATAFIWLWFREVKRVMQECRNTLESAEGELNVWRSRKEHTPEANEVLIRSEKIYEQALKQYNQTLKKPWVFFPGILLGFVIHK